MFDYSIDDGLKTSYSVLNVRGWISKRDWGTVFFTVIKVNVFDKGI